MKKMIFHIPMKIEMSKHRASHIRPQKMINAFRSQGYEVDIISGYLKERKTQITRIKKNILNGDNYDFVYSENSTMPTALTEKHHFPINPFLDFNFLKFCHDKNIKIGLFYRDIYWKLNAYKNAVSFYKRKFAEFFYNYDLREYNKFVDVLYLPSMIMYDYMKYNFKNKVDTLPPGLEILDKEAAEYKAKNLLSFIYVGGMSDNLNLNLFLEVISKNENLKFNICTRKDEWNSYKVNYKNNLENTELFFKEGKELEEVYNISDIGVYFIRPTEFGHFALGLKLFEYMTFLKPIVAVKNTAIGDFVEEKGIGWTAEYNFDKLSQLLDFIKDNPNEVHSKTMAIQKQLHEDTWEARAKKVIKDLS